MNNWNKQQEELTAKEHKERKELELLKMRAAFLFDILCALYAFSVV